MPNTLKNLLIESMNDIELESFSSNDLLEYMKTKKLKKLKKITSHLSEDSIKSEIRRNLAIIKKSEYFVKAPTQIKKGSPWLYFKNPVDIKKENVDSDLDLQLDDLKEDFFLSNEIEIKYDEDLDLDFDDEEQIENLDSELLFEVDDIQFDGYLDEEKAIIQNKIFLSKILELDDLRYDINPEFLEQNDFLKTDLYFLLRIIKILEDELSEKDVVFNFCFDKIKYKLLEDSDSGLIYKMLNLKEPLSIIKK